MQNLDKKRVFLCSSMGFLILLLFVTPCLAIGTISNPEAKGNGTYPSETLGVGVESGYYTLYADVGDNIRVTITWDQNDINRARMYLDDPGGLEVVDLNEDNEANEILIINHEAIVSGGFELRVRLYKDVSVCSFSLTIEGLTGSAPLLPDGLTNWIIISAVAISGIAAIVLIYRKV